MTVPTIHSNFHDAPLFLGKQPATEVRTEHASWAELRRPLVKAGLLPKIPAVFGHGNDFPGQGWHMFGNGPDDTVFPGFQGCGDCAFAGPGHAIMEAEKNAGRPVAPLTGKTVVGWYSAYSGYDPTTGANDNGSNPQDVFAIRKSPGLPDDAGTYHKIGPTIAATPGDLTHLWEIAYLFEDAGIGVAIQQAQEDQFNEGVPWNYVAGSPVVGGHWVEVMGRLHLITWAINKAFTNSFYTNLNDETYAWIDPERYNRVTGLTLEKLNDADLEKYLALVAAAKA